MKSKASREARVEEIEKIVREAEKYIRIACDQWWGKSPEDMSAEEALQWGAQAIAAYHCMRAALRALRLTGDGYYTHITAYLLRTLRDNTWDVSDTAIYLQPLIYEAIYELTDDKDKAARLTYGYNPLTDRETEPCIYRLIARAVYPPAQEWRRRICLAAIADALDETPNLRAKILELADSKDEE